MSYLLDTNVISELRKGRRCDPGVASWFSGVSSDDLFLSVLTFGEIRKGVERLRRRDPVAAQSLEGWLTRLVAAYSERAFAIDQPVAEQWGRLNAPDPLPVVDSLLAATAIVHGLTLVTRNVDDVARTGVDHLNPFES